jgi:hypothetical protein
MRLVGTLLAALAFGLVALAAPASAGFQEVFNDFKDDGTIDACRYTDGELAAVQVPPDIEQYAPDFLGALAAARERRASGACDPKPKQREREAEPAAAPRTSRASSPTGCASAAERPADRSPALPTPRIQT